MKNPIICQKIGSKYIIFDSNNSIMHTLNETAFFIYNKFIKKQDKKTILKQMAKKYQTDYVRLEKDYGQCIKQIKNKRLI